MTDFEKEYIDLSDQINNRHKYEIGDIIRVIKTDAHWLLEDIIGWEYCFRVLDNNDTRRESITYIDGHKGLVKEA